MTGWRSPVWARVSRQPISSSRESRCHGGQDPSADHHAACVPDEAVGEHEVVSGRKSLCDDPAHHEQRVGLTWRKPTHRAQPRTSHIDPEAVDQHSWEQLPLDFDSCRHRGGSQPDGASVMSQKSDGMRDQVPDSHTSVLTDVPGRDR